MKSGIACAVALLGAWVTPAALAAEAEPAPGQIVTVTCRHDSSQTYECYLPSRFDPAREWPILYCFDPNANGRAFVDDYREVCEKHGWIVAASNNSRNGPWEPIQAAMDAIWKDTQERFPVSAGRCYSTGWSGGSSVAFDLAASHGEHFAGVIPIAAGSGWEQSLPRLPERVSVYFVMGDQDSAEYARQQAAMLREKGHRTEVDIFPGGHVWPPKSTLENGVEWLMRVARQPSVRVRFQELETLEFRDELERKLGAAVRRARKGDLKGALATATKVLASEDSTPDEKEDAAHVLDQIGERLEVLSSTADQLIAAGRPYEARYLLELLEKARTGEAAQAVGGRIETLSRGREARKLLDAGKLYDRAMQSFEAGKEALGQKLLRDLLRKHAGTRYAELAADQL